MKSKVWRPLRWQKNLYSRPEPSAKQRSARLKFVKKNEALLWKGDGMIIFSWINAQNILFQLPNLKNYIVWGSK